MNILASSLGLSSSSSLSSHCHESVRHIENLLRDESVQVLSSLQLNQIASYTFHESSIANGQDLSEQIIELLGQVLSRPLEMSALTLQKTLVVVKHVLLFGAEKNLNSMQNTLHRFVPQYLEYNTALIAHQQAEKGIGVAGGVSGMLMRIQGGTVDKGGPVRQEAQTVNNLLSNRQALLLERSQQQQDLQSLVPVGSTQEVAFCTDEVRWRALQKRMERERTIQVKSNLAKQSSAFGSGYNAKDGKSVVGAAHGIDEMMKQAKKAEQAFCDDGKKQPQQTPQVSAADFADYMAPNEADLLQTGPASVNSTPIVNDLLGEMTATTTTTSAATHDLLGFGGGAEASTIAAATTTTADLLHGASDASSSLIPPATMFGAIAETTTTTTAASTTGTASLLDVAVSAEPAAATTAAVEANKKKNIMSTQSLNMNADPFAALDAAGGSNGTANSGTSIGLNGLSSALGAGGMMSTAATPPAPLSSSLQNNPLTDLSSLSISSSPSPSVPPSAAPSIMVAPTVSATSIKVGQSIPGATPTFDNGNEDNDDDDNGFVMGGAAGSGLVPAGPAPAAPPPPPPPPAGGNSSGATLPW